MKPFAHLERRFPSSDKIEAVRAAFTHHTGLICNPIRGPDPETDRKMLEAIVDAVYYGDHKARREHDALLAAIQTLPWPDVLAWARRGK